MKVSFHIYSNLDKINASEAFLRVNSWIKAGALHTILDPVHKHSLWAPPQILVIFILLLFFEGPLHMKTVRLITNCYISVITVLKEPHTSTVFLHSASVERGVLCQES